jgi:hypothetical protein
VSISQVEFSEILERFNRKERNLLVRDILGHRESKLRLSKSFLMRVNKAAKTDLGRDAWWATDFHFDWALAAAMMFCGKTEIGRVETDINDGLKLIQGTQEDVDLIIADGKNLVLIEAKAGEAWGQKQFDRKVKRLEALRHTAGGRLKVRLLLMSPKKSEKLKIPADSDIQWLDFIYEKILTGYRVQRCGADGKISADGGHWKIVEKAASNPVVSEEV